MQSEDPEVTMEEVIVTVHRHNLAPLFRGFPWNYLPDAILEGSLGRALADDPEAPCVATLEAPRLQICIVGGDAGHPAARAYLEQRPTPSGLFCGAEGWEELLGEVHRGRVVSMERYAFTSQNLDLERLRSLRQPGTSGPQG